MKQHKNFSIKTKILTMNTITIIITILSIVTVAIFLHIADSYRMLSDSTKSNIEIAIQEIESQQIDDEHLAQQIKKQFIINDLNTAVNNIVGMATVKQKIVVVDRNKKFIYSSNNLLKDDNLYEKYINIEKDYCGFDVINGNIVSVSVKKLTLSNLDGFICVINDIESSQLLNNLKAITGCDYSIFTGNMRTITTLDSQKENVLNVPMDSNIYDNYMSKDLDYSGSLKILGTYYRACYSPIHNTQNEVIGAIFAGTDLKGLQTSVEHIIIYISAIGILIVLVSLFILNKIQNKLIFKPLKEITKASEKIAQGDFNFEIKSNRTDEMGIVMYQFSIMSDTTKAIMNDIDYIMDNIATKNLLVTSQDKSMYIGDYSNIYESILKFKDSMTNSFQNINNTILSFGNSTKNINVGAENLSQATSEQLISIEQLSSNIDKIKTMINNTLNTVNITNSLFNEAISNVNSGKKEMDSLISSINTIEKSSSSINNIISVIEDIAFQTKILSINASIEAIQAGSAGKSFAVVAEEVRTLAHNTETALNNITALITETITNIQKAYNVAKQSCDDFDKIYNNVYKGNNFIKNITKDTNMQSVAADEISHSINQIIVRVEDNGATAQESAASCEELHSQTEQLKNLLSTYKFNKNTKPEKTE